MENSNKATRFFKYGLNGSWEFRQRGESEWLPATVPGCSHTDLMANDRIPDPFFRDNESGLQWIEQEDWEYRRFFEITQAQLDSVEINLVAEGLDSCCDIYINRELVGVSDNMFVGQSIPCRQHLKLGANLLEVQFHSPLKKAYEKFRQVDFVYPAENDKTEEKLSVYCRKAPYHFGWDWGPRFVTSGIWKNIYLECIADAKIAQVGFTQHSLSNTQADFSFQLKIKNHLPLNAKLKVTCEQAPELNREHAISFDMCPQGDGHDLNVVFSLVSPKLWWPNGLGDPFLYHFKFELIGEEGPIHGVSETIGLRTVEVVNKADAMGESFFIKVNGHQVFMKGANYIPADSFVHRVTLDKHQQFFDAVVYANMNMLRVWGGGIYQDDDFYRLADEKGILIWQDFMFACSLYPADEDFINNVQREAEYNILRLRNHACIALWCGNNEVEMGIKYWGWPEKFSYSKELFDGLKQDYMTLFDQCLRAEVAKHDSQRFYLRSSPIGFWEADEDNKGNHHYWGVWHGEEPFSEYQRRIPRFMSEFGFQSFSMIETVRRYTQVEDLTLDSPVMQAHQKHPRGNKLMRNYMESEFNRPKDFSSLLYLSQVQQALGLKLAFEAHREAMPFCMGSLYWQLNDTWPAASWSGIDYYGRWKALHYQARRSFDEQLIVIREEDKIVSVTVISDKLEAIQSRLQLCLVNMTGQTLWSYESTIEVPANSSERVFEVPSGELLDSHLQSDVVLLGFLDSCDGKTLAENNYFFLPNHSLALQRPNLSLQKVSELERLSITLATDVVVRQLYLSVPGIDENFTDNFFDLIPGRPRTVGLRLPGLKQEEIEKLAEQISCFSLIDSYVSDSAADQEVKVST